VRPQLNANLCHTGNIHINSLKSPYTVIRIDGLPIGRGLSTLYGLTGIPQSLIEGVKIVKDPASTLYGSEAVGGVINIVTKEPYASPRISIVNFTTIFNEVHTNVGARYALSKTVDLLLGISYLNYQNPIDNNGANFTNLTQQNRISIFNKLNIDLDILNVLPLAGRYVYEDRWRGGMDWTIANRIGDEVSGESIFTNRWTFFGNYDLPGREDLSFQFSAYEHKQDSFYGETSYQASQYRGVGQLVRNKKLSSKHDLFMGAAYRYTYYDDTMFTTSTVNGLSNNPSLIHLPGVFVQDEISLKENKKLLLGMKYDYNNVHPSVLSPGAHFKCNNSKKTDILRINAGSGFKVAPIFTEDHAPLTGERQVVSEGALRPETSWSSSVVHVKSFTTKNNTFINLDATACYTYFTNRIIPDYDTDPDQSIYAHLDGNSISQGVSLNAHIVFKNGLKELAGATFMEFFITEGGERTRPLLTEGYVGVWSMALGLNVDNTDSLYGYVGLPFLSNTNAYPDATDPRDGNSPVRSIQNIHPTKKLGYTRKLFGGVKNLLNFTPADNSIARAFEPFDRGVNFNSNGKAVPTSGIPNGLTFNPAFMYAYYQGILGFSGIRYTVF
jgi:outer membrane receptor for ferrienterochelin and colicins